MQNIQFKQTYYLLLVFTVLITTACGNSQTAGDADLERASRAIQSLLKPINLNRSGFMNRTGQQASDFVDYLFSEMGVTELAGPSDVMPGESRGAAPPSLPANVSLIRSAEFPVTGKQIVISADDKNNQLILTAYSDPSSVPLFEKRITFPNLQKR